MKTKTEKLHAASFARTIAAYLHITESTTKAIQAGLQANGLFPKFNTEVNERDQAIFLFSMATAPSYYSKTNYQDFCNHLREIERMDKNPITTISKILKVSAENLNYFAIDTATGDLYVSKKSGAYFIENPLPLKPYNKKITRAARLLKFPAELVSFLALSK